MVRSLQIQKQNLSAPFKKVLIFPRLSKEVNASKDKVYIYVLFMQKYIF